MTAYYQPLQRTEDSRWDYTRGTGSSPAHAIGYCAGWHEWTDEELARISIGREWIETERQRLLPFRDKYHTDGHATSREAHDCYENFLLDTQLVFHTKESEQHKCKVCGLWTQTLGSFLGEEHRYAYLCRDHANRDGMKAALDLR